MRFPESRTVFWSNPGSREYPSRPCDKYGTKEKSYQLFPVTTLSFQATITQSRNERSDSWSEAVRGRIESVNDLPAAGAVYRYLCGTNCRTGKQTPKQFLPDDALPRKKQKSGRPTDATKQDAYDKVVEYLEGHEDEQTTVRDLTAKMQ